MRSSQNVPVSLEKKTFTLHLISQFFNGLALGILILQDVILKKTLGGSNFDVMLLMLLTHSSNLVSLYGSEIVNRSYNRAKSIITLGLIGNVSLMVIPILSVPWFYIFCLIVNVITNCLLLPVWNIVFKHNYSESNRSKLFSYASTLQIAVLLVTTTIFGNYLDINTNLYKIMFPLAGLCGMVTYQYLARMISLSMDDYDGKKNNSKSYFTMRDYKDILAVPGRNLVRILKNDRPFLRFEVYFFLYGVAFMVLTPVVPVFLVDNLQLSYSPISFAKGLVFYSAYIVFTPIMGRFHSKGSPAKYCGYVFLLLSLHPLVLVLAKFITGNAEFIVYISYFLFGFAMSGVSIAWSLSTLHYAPFKEVSNYQAVHVTLTGVRGLFSPAIGYLVMKLFAIQYSFFLSALLFMLSGVFMFKEARVSSVSLSKEVPAQ